MFKMEAGSITIDMIGACQVKVKCLKQRQVLQIIDMTGACQVKAKCFKMEASLMNYRNNRCMSDEN